MRRFLKKQCSLCHVIADVPARQRKCHERRFGRGSYCCWGRLVKVITPKKEKKPMPENVNVENRARPQDIAQKKLEHARKMVTVKMKTMTRLATQLRAWEKKASYYARRASLTDAEIAAEQVKRAERMTKRPKRRAIKLARRTEE